MKGKMTSVEGINVYTVAPDNRDSRAAVLLIHEWWGLNDITKGWADDVAKMGYHAAAIDLFDGKVTDDKKVAARLMEEADPKACLVKLGKVLRWMHDAKGMEMRKVVTCGYCFGGGWSLQCALHYGDKVAGSVIYYGQLETDAKKLEGCKVPLFGIFARKDDWITIGMVNKFEHACRDAKVPHEVHVYDAGHAFATRIHENYNPTLAKDAAEKVAAFYKRVLG